MGTYSFEVNGHVKWIASPERLSPMNNLNNEDGALGDSESLKHPGGACQTKQASI